MIKCIQRKEKKGKRWEMVAFIFCLKDKEGVSFHFS